VDLASLDASVESVEAFNSDSPHDGPRPGASMLIVELTNSSERFVFGSPDERQVLWSDEVGAFGPDGPWTGGRCVQVDPGEDATRILCTGGLRGNEVSADLLILERGADGAWTVDEQPDALPTALLDPLWYSDETALYAQGEGQLLRIARDSWEADNIVSSAQRFAEGHSVQLPTGATFQVGGYGQEGQPLTRWQVFMPALQP
jgi:hypothetical protein